MAVEQPAGTAEDDASAVLGPLRIPDQQAPAKIARSCWTSRNAIAWNPALLSERTGVQTLGDCPLRQVVRLRWGPQMQRLFRDGLLSGTARWATANACASSLQNVEGKAVAIPSSVLGEFVAGNVLASAEPRQDHRPRGSGCCGEAAFPSRTVTSLVSGVRSRSPPTSPIRCCRWTRRTVSSKPGRHVAAAGARHHRTRPADRSQLPPLCGLGRAPVSGCRLCKRVQGCAILVTGLVIRSQARIAVCLQGARSRDPQVPFSVA